MKHLYYLIIFTILITQIPCSIAMDASSKKQAAIYEMVQKLLYRMSEQDQKISKQDQVIQNQEEHIALLTKQVDLLAEDKKNKEETIGFFIRELRKFDEFKGSIENKVKDCEKELHENKKIVGKQAQELNVIHRKVVRHEKLTKGVNPAYHAALALYNHHDEKINEICTTINDHTATIQKHDDKFEEFEIDRAIMNNELGCQQYESDSCEIHNYNSLEMNEMSSLTSNSQSNLSSSSSSLHSESQILDKKRTRHSELQAVSTKRTRHA